MALRVHPVLTVLAAIVVAASVCACGSGSGGDEASPTATPSPRSSAQATAEARATLRAFFAAWQAKDVPALERYLPADRKGGEWQFEGLDRVDFGKIVESPEQVAGYLTSGRGSVSGVKAEDVRCFQADVTFFYTPGFQGSADGGQPLPWYWFLERGAEGDWLVTDQGV